MFETDNKIIAHALQMWANHIETGDVLMSPQDAIDQGKHKRIKALEVGQQSFLVKIKYLAKEYRNK